MASYSVFVQMAKIKNDCAHRCNETAKTKFSKAKKRKLYKRFYTERDRLLIQVKEPKRNPAAAKNAATWLSVGLAQSIQGKRSK